MFCKGVVFHSGYIFQKRKIITTLQTIKQIYVLPLTLMKKIQQKTNIQFLEKYFI